jgi:hypothetical protein
LRKLWPVFSDASRRGMHLAILSIPVGLTLTVWKVALLVVSPLLFMLVNVTFSFGVVAAKYVAVRAPRFTMVHYADQPSEVLRHRRRGYRVMGMTLVIVAGAYSARSIPMFLGLGDPVRYDRPVAVIIATLTFLELGLSSVGVLAARRAADVLLEYFLMTSANTRNGQ